MVRQRARQGGQGRIRKGGIPGSVKQHPVNTNENRRGLIVGPGKQTVQQRDLVKAKAVDGGIEKASSVIVEIVI